MLLIFGGQAVYLSALDTMDLVCGGCIAVCQSFADLILSYDHNEDYCLRKCVWLPLTTIRRLFGS